MTVVTRFAPSPTGFLHIGGVRTALFNYLFAKHNNGKFLLRIEDTDKHRSTQPAIDAIIDGLDWLGLNPDDSIVMQSENIEKHIKSVQMLLDNGLAYYCYTTPEELAEQRQQAEANKENFSYDRKWRDSTQTPPENIKPVVRFKSPLEGKTTIEDAIQGSITIDNSQLDDYILLRSDGTPTYMLSVVVDDIEMNITHIIRGDDHLNNAFRQIHLFKALKAEVPIFAHLPLIHGSDGKKLSKRHGALGTHAYKDMGYIPESLKNYLSRLGWAHGDDEIFSEEQAVEWFTLEGCGKSAAKMDFDKMESLNAHYIREKSNDTLLPLVLEILPDISDTAKNRIEKGLSGLKERAKTLNDFKELSVFYIDAPTYPLEDKKAEKMIKEGSPAILKTLITELENLSQWDSDTLETTIKSIANDNDWKFGEVAQPIRATLSGTVKSPAIFEMMEVLGKEESLKRFSAIL